MTSDDYDGKEGVRNGRSNEPRPFGLQTVPSAAIVKSQSNSSSQDPVYDIRNSELDDSRGMQATIAKYTTRTRTCGRCLGLLDYAPGSTEMCRCAESRHSFSDWH